MPAYHHASRSADFQLGVFITLLLSLATACKKSTDTAGPSGDFLAIMNVGKSQYEKSDFTAATASFTQAVQQQPTSIDARLNLANALLAAGQPEQVFAQTAQVLGMDPLSGAAHYLAGCAYLRQGKFEDALKSLQQAKDIDRTVNEVSFQLGVAYEGLRNYDDAIKQWRETIEFGPEHPAAYYRLSQVLIRQGATDEAAALLEKHREVTAGRTIPSDPSFFEQCLHTQMRVPFVLEQPDEKGIDVKFVEVTAEWLPDASSYTGPVGLIDFQRLGQPGLLVIHHDQFRLLAFTNGQFQAAGTPVPAKADGGYTKVLVGDLDNDRYEDAIVLGANNSHVLKLGAEGRITDRTLLTGLNQLKAVDGELADLDFTSKLSLVVALPGDQGIRFHRNLGNVMFRDDTAAIGLPTNAFAATQVTVADWDKNDLPDVIAAGDGATRVFANQRGGQMTETNVPSLTAAARRVIVQDLNNDFRPDAAKLDGRQLTVSYGGLTNRVTLELGGEFQDLAALDYDNDGWLDLLAYGPAGVRVWRNLGARGFVETTSALGLTANQVKQVFAADLDNDCDTDLIFVLDGGALRFWRNDGGNRNHMVKLKAVGNRSNHSGLGTRFEFTAGNWRGMRTVRQTPLEIGIGKHEQIDSAFVQWTQLRMNVEAIQAGECRVAFITEIEQKQMTSCPYLYAWDGTTFRFVSDFLAAAPIGLPVAPSRIIAADPEELLWIGNETMFPAKDGKFVVKLTEELSEVLYLDEVKLVAVDHPVGTEVFSTSKMLPSPPWLPHEIMTLHNRVPLLKATSNTRQEVDPFSSTASGTTEAAIPLTPALSPGEREPHAVALGSATAAVTKSALDVSQRSPEPSPLPAGAGQGQGARRVESSTAFEVTEHLQHIDNVRVSPEIYGDHLRGWAKLQETTLDFGPLDHTKPLVLALNGWLRFGGAMANIAASHRADLPFPFPKLAVETGDGAWQPVDVRFGTPAGRTKSIIVELTGKLPAGAQRLKLSHAFELHWDQIALYEQAGEERTQIARLSPSSTDLHYRGFSEDAPLDWTHPTTPIHDRVAATPLIPKVPAGWATRYGAVDELIAEKDNAFVLINGGDALTVEFDASQLAPTPAGYQRQFFLWSVGWDKDGDYYTVLGDQLEPWPWHGMDDQLYGRQPRPAFPTDELMKKYTTRWVGPWVPSRREVARQ
jgi:Flp pilus assembly protein TadD